MEAAPCTVLFRTPFLKLNIMYKTMLFVLGFLCPGAFLLAQSNATEKAPMPIRITLFTEAKALTPGFHFHKYPVHPGVSVGTQWNLKQNEHTSHSLGLTLGGYYHPTLQAAVFLLPEYVYRYEFDFGLRIDAKVGAGYQHSFHPKPIFVPEDGTYVEKRDPGTPGLLLSGSLEIGYQLGAKPTSPIIYAQYTYAGDIPTTATSIHQMGGIGITFFPFQ